MPDNEKNNKRIVKNTAYLYFRMIFQLIIGLYTSRVILNALGVTDYGIYNVVGGVVAMFGFINGSMGTATSRFLTYELGKENDPVRMRHVFSTALLIHLGICVFVLILSETIGLWYIYNKLVLPPDRLTAALWVFQFSILTSLIAIISVPYNAAIVSHEKMSAFAYISIYEVAMQLVVAITVKYITYDKLITYGLLLMLVQISVRIIYGIYCSKKFKEVKGKFIFDSTTSKEMIRFAFWIMNGSLAVIGYTEGLNLLLNLFFGPTINAARGIAVTIQSKVIGFCNNFQMAVNPQITKSYASNDLQYMYQLICNSSKYSLYLVFFLSFPIILETKYILKIWLGLVPDYTDVFVQITLIIGMIDALRMPINTAIHATGRIKLFQSIEGTSLLLVLPVSYIFLKYGYSPICVFLIQLLIFIIVHAERVFIVCPTIGMPKKMYFKQVVWEPFKVLIPASILPLFFKFNSITTNEFLNFLFVSMFALLCTALSILYIGLDKLMRGKIKNLIFSKIAITKK